MPVSLPSFLLNICRTPATAVGLPVLLGIGSGLVTRSSVNTWYSTQKKPAGEPPRAAFPIVWTILYASMGYASHIAVTALDRSPSGLVRIAANRSLVLYFTQLGLNLIWTPLFFGLHRTELALVDIVALTTTVFATTNELRKVDKRAMWLFVPYCAWLSWATYLNAGVWHLNRQPSKPEIKKVD